MEQHHADGENQQPPIDQKPPKAREIHHPAGGLRPGMAAGPDRPQRRQRRQAQRGSQQEHEPRREIRPRRPHDGGGQAIADRCIAGIASQPLAQRGVSGNVQADRRDRRRDDATGEAVQHLRHQHRQLLRLHRQQQRRGDDAEQRPGGGDPLVAHRVHQHAGRKLTDQRGHRAQSKGIADLDLRPLIGRQVHRDEWTKPGLHVGHEKIDQVERSVRSQPPCSEQLHHAIKAMPHRRWPV